MKQCLAKRIARLQTEMRKSHMDAVIFADRENLVYYADTVEVECMAAVIPAAGEPVLCCLWLDAPYVKARSGANRIRAYKFPSAAVGPAIVGAMKELGLNDPVVGFHKYFVDFPVFDAVRSAFPGMQWRSAAEITYRVRSVKDAEEMARMTGACNYVDAGMRAAVDFLRPGVTEVAVLAEADYAMRKAGSEGASFRMQVLTWPKQLLAHPYAGNVVIEDNQPVVIHLGATCEGYTAKMGRTVFLGEVPEETVKIYNVLRDIQDRAVSACKPGMKSSEIYDYACLPLREAGYDKFFLAHLGYGVGIRQSEFYPVIGKGIDHVLEKDMVVDLLLPTIYKRGAGGPRLTDMVRVSEGGGVRMTAFSRDVLRK
ncbi:MAG: Xaa-Pro peptidase family protein [Desulfovibrio sp.]|nr:Xaa-Pro peptidase family protein [Desulfovibrio sp.]